MRLGQQSMFVENYWVQNANLGERQGISPEMSHKDLRSKFNQGHVQVTVGPHGTEIKWAVLSPCLSSLFFLSDWLQDARAPYVLRFYVSGWFEEFHETYDGVCRRLDEIIARGDRHFSSRTFVQQVDPAPSTMTPLLNDCLSNKISPEDYAIECRFAEDSKQFVVEKVGSKSPIGKFYGTSLSSFPCQSMGSFNDTVSQAYWSVLDSGKPRCDHVMAAFRLPDNQVHWVPYQRLILPNPQAKKNNQSVVVISEISPISFKVI
jgi:hypothetical protein